MSNAVINKLLDILIEHKASDLYLTVGAEPSVRKDEYMIKLKEKKLTQLDVATYTQDLLTKEQLAKFESSLELNISVTDSKENRFRINFFKQQQHPGIIIRRIETKVPSIEELNLPDLYRTMAMEKSGLVIIASPGGSGKTTSMAAMVNYRNQNGKGHILTIEDPIEFIHHHEACIVTQREVGVDTFSYSMALKNALRQRADVIGIGEIRDKDAMEHALRFSETGHLCIATLHSNNASQTLDRMINLFPEDMRRHVLLTLSQNLRGILSQKLIRNVRNERIMVAEILLNEGLIKTLIADDALHEVRDVFERHQDSLSKTFDESLIELFQEGEISIETALISAENRARMKLKLHHIAPEEADSIKLEFDDDQF